MNLPGVRASTLSLPMSEGFSGEYRGRFHKKDNAHICSSVFNDFGSDFACVDPTGENPGSGMVVSIDEGEDAVVTCMDEVRHGLEDGDFVTFSEVKGMEVLNGCEPRKITTKGMFVMGLR